MLKNKEIASILNISPAAVSLALNNKHGVSEETRRRVQALRNGSVAAAFNELQLQSSNNGAILFLVLKKHGNVIANTPFFMSLSESLHQQASIEGYGLQVSYFQPGNELGAYLHALNINRYDGILVLATEADAEDIRRICALGKPVVAIDAWFDTEKTDCVLMDNENGILQAVRYAYQMGHRRIGYLNSYARANNFQERLRAYRAALEMLGLPCEEKYIFSIHSQLDGASRDMEAILREKSELPTVFVCANDLVAMGAMEALNRFGLRVPRDISLIGFDDMPVSAHMNPPLSSVRIYNRKIATMSVQILADKMRGGKQPIETLRCLVGVDLMPRESVRKMEDIGFSGEEALQPIPAQ